MKTNISGVGVALITPFTESKEVDYPALGRLVEYVSNNGVDYLVALGTTAETPTLTCDEKTEIVSFIKKHNKKSLPLVLGVGGNSTDEVIKKINEFDLTGIHSILSVTPYYNKPSQRGLFEHYKAVAEGSPRPIILYNVPGRTGVNMCAETTLRIAHQVPNVIGIKEACGAIGQFGHLLMGRPEGFLVISGDDNMALPLLSYGGDGVISVAANAFPEVFTQMIKAATDNRRQEAAALQMRLLEPIERLFDEGNPVGIKAALAVKGMITNTLRLPLVESSDKLYEKLTLLIKQHNL